TVSCSVISRRISTGAPVPEPYALESIFNSSSFSAPAVGIAFHGLHEQVFYDEHDGDESDRIREDRDHVEQREGGAKHKANAVGTANQFEHQHYLQDDRNS